MLPFLRRGLQHKTVTRSSTLVQTRGFSKLAAIDSSKITVTRTKTPQPKVETHKLVFGRTFTDHMLSIEWDEHKGFDTPRVVPFGELSIHPAASCLHYALECFEGMKAYKDDKGKIRLFRPEMNMDRLYKSCQRLALPLFDKTELLECIKTLIRTDRDWIPSDFGYSLYIRPTVISTAPFLGVGPTKKANFFTILCPVGPYYPRGFNPVKLYATTEYVRAWPGGSGNSKVGANYGPTILPQVEVAKKGYDQILWLFDHDHKVTEVGTMNIFFLWKRRDGATELITAPLEDGTILPGVTRNSILDLTRKWGEFEVTERAFTMKEVAEAIKEGRMLEAFGAGTAAIISPVMLIHYKGTDYDVPLDPSDKQARSGKLAKRLFDDLMNIQYGRTKSDWSVVID